MLAGRAVAAGLVLAIAGCGAASGTTAEEPVGPAGAEATVAAPPGWQKVSSLGLEVDAPGSWPINPWPCGPTPEAEILRAQGAVPLCGRSPARSSLEIRQLVDGIDTAPPSPASTPVVRHLTLNGVAASSSLVRLADGRTEGTLTVPAKQVYLVVSSPDASIPQRVLASARLVDVDSAGCATAQPSDPAWDRLRPGPKVNLLAAGTPTAIVVCLYQRFLPALASSPGETAPGGAAPGGAAPGGGAPGQGTLAASVVLTGAPLTTAVAAIDAAAAGPSPDVPRGNCLPGQPEDTPLWLHVHRAGGATTDVRVRYSSCADRWTATSDGLSQVTEAQLEALLKPIHTGYTFSGPLPKR